MCEAYCRCLYTLRGRLVKTSTVDKSKIKDKIKVKPKDKCWVRIRWGISYSRRRNGIHVEHSDDKPKYNSNVWSSAKRKSPPHVTFTLTMKAASAGQYHQTWKESWKPQKCGCTDECYTYLGRTMSQMMRY